VSDCDAELQVVSVLVATDPGSIVSSPVDELSLDLGGVVGDRHYGVARPSNSRQARFYPRGTLIRNRRQVSLVAEEELEQVRIALDLPDVRPDELGANVLVRGMPGLSALPIGARLLFDNGLGLVCEGVNQPCRLPVEALRRRHPDHPSVSRFVKHAFGRRGIVASVEHPAPMRAGDHACVYLPELHATLV
jgi:MOSC domain